MYSRIAYNYIKEQLVKLGLNYAEDDNTGLIRVLQIGSSDKPQDTYAIFIQVRETDYLLHGRIDNVAVPSSRFRQVSEILMRINQKYNFPQLVLSFDNGAVSCRYRYQIENDFLLKKEGSFEAEIGLVLRHMVRHNLAIQAVASGSKSPQDALNLVK